MNLTHGHSSSLGLEQQFVVMQLGYACQLSRKLTTLAVRGVQVGAHMPGLAADTQTGDQYRAAPGQTVHRVTAQA